MTFSHFAKYWMPLCVWLGVIFSRVDGPHVGGTYVALSRLAPALVRTENHSRSVRAGLVSRTQGGASYGVHDSRYSPFAHSLSRNENENENVGLVHLCLGWVRNFCRGR